MHPEVLPKLNKQITADSYRKAVGFLTNNRIPVRTFLLLNPPFLTDRRENIEWTMRSIEFSLCSGSDCCTIIPTRPGNGIMERLQKKGRYRPPSLDALEEVFERALKSYGTSARIFADLWDLERFADCSDCFDARRKRLERMNLEQRVLPGTDCRCK